MSTTPSEHAMRAAKELGGGDIEAHIIDTHAIAPAVADCTRECEEHARLLGAGASREAALMAKCERLERALESIGALTISHVASGTQGFQWCRDIACKALAKHGGAFDPHGSPPENDGSQPRGGK